MKVTVIPIVIGAHRIDKGTGKLGRTSGEHPKSTIKMGQNTEKGFEDLRRLAVTQTPFRDYRLTLE